MRVLVTGASGFLGSRVSDALLARGDEVVGLSRDPDRAGMVNPTVSWHAWNAATERPAAAALEGVDGVINLIGESLNQRWNEEVKQRIRESRERTTKNLIDALSASDPRPRVLVSQSAVGYYGDRGVPSSTSRRRPARRSTPPSARRGRPPPAPPRRSACGWRSPARDWCSIPSRGC